MSCYSQIPPNPGDNVLDPHIDKFVGTWKWQEGNNSLTLIIKKENILFPNLQDIRADWVVGFHKFVKNGVTLEDSTMYSNTTFSDKKHTVSGKTKYNHPNILVGGIGHKSKKKYVNYEIEYIDPTHIKIISLKNPEGTRVRAPGEPPFDWSISLPSNIILTKQ